MINTNSPLLLDGAMADGMIEMARAGQAVAITPFTLSGAMAPATIAGALTQQNAEALAATAVVQIAAPGAPTVYGGFTSNVDMKTGAPAFGTPECTQAALAGGQLARFYGLPYRSSNVNTSNAVDAQAAYESEMSIWATMMGHANVIHQGAGWLEGGLTASFEKMIIDAEMLQMMAETLLPIEVNTDTLGLDAMAEAGPGGHFFGTAHTLERYETAFYEPMVSDWRNFESWEEAGSADATQRANGIWKQMLKDYEQPPLDPAIDEELKAFIARRKEEEKAAA
jgi:trimethylamine--corrinoid protein Co-methyltransferase